MPTRKPRAVAPADSNAARELELYADNDHELYHLKLHTYWTAALKKVQAGKFDPEKAVKLFEYYTERAAQKYVREFGGSMGSVFSVATRRAAARECVAEFISALQSGEISAIIGNQRR